MRKNLIKLVPAFLGVMIMVSAFAVPALAAPSPVMYESSGSANAIDIFYGASWRALTFTPAETHTLTGVQLPLIRRGTAAGNVIVSIRQTDSSGYPTGPDLAAGTVPVSSISSAWSPMAWYSFDLGAGCVVEKGKTYAIVWRAPNAGAMYYWVNLNGTYSGGRALYGNGTSWSNLRTWDAAFREYGQTVTADVPRPPVVAPIGNQTVYRDTWIEFNVTATDPNDDELTYWAENVPAGATFDAEEQFFEWKRPAVPGVYTITFKVFDGGFGVKYKVTITVKDIPQGQSIINLCPVDSYNLIGEHADDPDFVILDIRTQEEYDSGHIEGATILDFYAEDFASKLVALDRNKTYFIYCRTGHRTGLALNMMAELGYTNVYNLEEGITAWTEADYPTVTPGSPTPTTTPPPTSGG